jgi:hypothetical protein
VSRLRRSGRSREAFALFREDDACVLKKIMTNAQMTKMTRFDHALQAAVLQSWGDLMPDPSSGQIDIEYETGSDGALEFLKIWSSTVRGCWNLVCEMWLQAFWSNFVGLTFAWMRGFGSCAAPVSSSPAS